jgi:hypothetical protein
MICMLLVLPVVVLQHQVFWVLTMLLYHCGSGKCIVTFWTSCIASVCHSQTRILHFLWHMWATVPCTVSLFMTFIAGLNMTVSTVESHLKHLCFWGCLVAGNVTCVEHEAIRFCLIESDIVLLAHTAPLPFEKKGEEKVTEICMWVRITLFQ